MNKIVKWLEFLALVDNGQLSLMNIGFMLVLFKLFVGPASSSDLGAMIGVLVAHMHANQLASKGGQ